MSKPKLYTAKQMASILSLNVQSVYRLGREGKIPTIRVSNGTVRFYMPERKDKTL